MTSQPVALLLATLGVVPSHSRPQVPDDNPFSEAQFKTLKYRRRLLVALGLAAQPPPGAASPAA